MASDSNEIDAALLLKLSGDGPLLALMTDGVWWDEAPPDKTKFVIVSLSHSADEQMMPGVRAIEEMTYLVKAVARTTGGTEVKAASARIDALLEGGTIAPTGYGLMSMHRVERIRFTEVDENTDLRWQHRGGLYEVTVST